MSDPTWIVSHSLITPLSRATIPDVAFCSCPRGIREKVRQCLSPPKGWSSSACRWAAVLPGLPVGPDLHASLRRRRLLWQAPPHPGRPPTPQADPRRLPSPPLATLHLPRATRPARRHVCLSASRYDVERLQRRREDGAQRSQLPGEHNIFAHGGLALPR